MHYLLHGEEGRHADAFVRYLQRAAAGDGRTAVFYEEVDLRSEELQAGLERHLKKLDVR